MSHCKKSQGAPESKGAVGSNFPWLRQHGPSTATAGRSRSLQAQVAHQAREAVNEWGSARVSTWDGLLPCRLFPRGQRTRCRNPSERRFLSWDRSKGSVGSDPTLGSLWQAGQELLWAQQLQDLLHAVALWLQPAIFWHSSPSKL